LNGTIATTLERLLPLGYVPNHRKLRRALGVPDEHPSSFYFEPYDNTPIIDTGDPATLERIQSLMAKSDD
jgi:hypothetical protein